MSDYILDMRRHIGNAPLLVIGCGVIIENCRGEILLQRRTDDGTWGTPGGGMNFGETFVRSVPKCERRSPKRSERATLSAGKWRSLPFKSESR